MPNSPRHVAAACLTCVIASLSGASLIACSSASTGAGDGTSDGAGTPHTATIKEKPGTAGSPATTVATWNGKECKTVEPPKDPPYLHGGTQGGGSGCAVSDSVCGLFKGDAGFDPGHNDYANLVLDGDGIAAKTYTFTENPGSAYWGGFFGKQFPYMQVVADMWSDSISELFVALNGKLVLTYAHRDTREFAGYVENVILVELVKAPDNGPFAEQPTDASRCLFVKRWDFDTRVRIGTPCNNPLECNNSAMLICDYTSKTCQMKQCHDNWPPDDRECPMEQRCWEQNSGWGDASSGVCMPVCDPIKPSACEAGFSCEYMGGRDYLTPMCIPSGAGKPGDSCGGEGRIDTRCVLGNTCVWGSCHKQCDFWRAAEGCSDKPEDRCNFLPGVYSSGFCGKPPFDGGGIPQYNSLDPAKIGEKCKSKGDQPWDGTHEGTNHGHRCGDDGIAIRGICDDDLTCRKFCRIAQTKEDKALYAVSNGDCPKGQSCEPFGLFDGGLENFNMTFDGLGACR